MLKRKTLSLLLALALCLGLLPMTVLAAPVYGVGNEPTEEESWSHFELQSDNAAPRDVEPIDLYSYTPADPTYLEEEGYEVDEHGYYIGRTIDHYTAVNPETLFLVQNTAPEGTNCYVSVEAEVYQIDEHGEWTLNEGKYNNICSMHTATLTDDGMLTHEFVFEDPESGKECHRLDPGEWATFRLHYQDTSDAHRDGGPLEDGTIVVLNFYVRYPDCNSEEFYGDWGRWWGWAYYIDSSVPERDPNDPIVFPTVGQDKTKTEEPQPEPQPGYLTQQGVNILLTQRDLTDVGIWYNMELTNTTDQPIQGAYGILFHDPNLLYDYTFMGKTETLLRAQFMFFDLDLAPGATVKIGRNSEWGELTKSSAVWLAFDSPEEREDFVNSSPIRRLSETYLGDDFNYFGMPTEEGLKFLKDTFGLTPAD